MNKKLPLKYLAAFIVALILLVFTTVNGSRAALIYSANYEYDFEMYDIGISLEEKCGSADDYTIVGYRNYRSYESEEDDGTKSINGEWKTDSIPLLNDEDFGPFTIGKTYDEHLRVRNTGTIDEYVRVRVYKYWMKKVDGSFVKDQSLDPSKIELTFNTENGDWIIDESAQTEERTVLYYKEILPSGEATPDFVDTIKINNNVIDSVDKTVTEYKEGNKKYKTIVYTYRYNDTQFCLEVEADAIQTHNPKEAIKSIWGVDGSAKGMNIPEE